MLRSLLLLLVLSVSVITLGQEICDNGIDDDNDGLIDLNDTIDCNCNLLAGGVVTSFIPNHSFEDTLCCPYLPSQVACADNWVQASIATSDYYHLCSPLSIFSPPQTPLPGGGNGYVGFAVDTLWNEQVGTCLNSPLLAGTSYTLSFYTAWGSGPATNTLALYGTPFCSDLPWNTMNCPIGSGAWQLLSTQSVTYSTNGAWQQITMTFTPSVTINAISLGGTCGNDAIVVNYYYADELTLNTTAAFGSVTQSGELCTNDLVLYENFITPGDSVQWFLDGVALVGETNDSLEATLYGPGDYAVLNYVVGDCELETYTVSPAVYPTASFSYIQGNCLGETFVFFNDTSVSAEPIDSWYWDMDDNGPLSYTYHQFYAFNTAGPHDVDLIVATDLGCEDTATLTVMVNPLPDALFELTANGVTYQPAAGDTILVCDNYPIQFTNLSTIDAPGTITQYNWIFGDLNTSPLTDPLHQYGGLGYYTVILEATSDNGCEASFSCVVQIVATPIPDFSVSDECENLPLDFINNSSIASGSIVSHQWHFGDNNTSNVLNPTHLYANDGSYTAQLIVESEFGCVDSISIPLTIWDAPIADFQIQNHCLNETINFIDQSTIQNGNITTWQWQFGDNNSAVISNPSHNYGVDGTYTVHLIVETNDGCKDTLFVDHTIYPVPEVDFEVENACENEWVNFTNNSSVSSGNIAQFNWNFGNNTNSNLAAPPAISYPDFGTYPIHLELVSDQGCVSIDSNDLTIHKSPIAQILGDPMMGCSPFDAPMFNLVNPETYRCVWDFGNGETVIDCGSVRSTYEPGVYDVSVIVYSANGCADSTTAQNFITVYESPIADFEFSPIDINVHQSHTTLVNQSIGGANYQWDFGDNSGISTDFSPVHEFPQVAGNYSTTLIVHNAENTCADEITKTIVVHDEVIFYVPNAFTPGEDDHHNAIFKPVFTAGIDVYAYTLTIFNRWGEILFISHDPAVGWDGTYNSADIVQGGVYIWQIHYEVVNKDERLTERGVVNVVR